MFNCTCMFVYAYFPRSNIRCDYLLYCCQHLRWHWKPVCMRNTACIHTVCVSEKQSMCMYLCVNVLPRRLYSVPVPIMDGVMGIFDPPHTGTHVPEEIHLALTHLQGQEINLRHTEDKRKILYINWNITLCIILLVISHHVNTVKELKGERKREREIKMQWESWSTYVIQVRLTVSTPHNPILSQITFAKHVIEAMKFASQRHHIYRGTVYLLCLGWVFSV